MESARIQLLDEPISPELCLVDPDLAQRARQLAPVRPFQPRVVPATPAPPLVRMVQLEPARLVSVAAAAPVESAKAGRVWSARSLAASYWPLVMPVIAVGALIVVSLRLPSNHSPKQAAAPAVHIPDRAPTTIPTHPSVLPRSARSSVPRAALEPKGSAAPSVPVTVPTTVPVQPVTGHSAAGSTSAPTASHPPAGAGKAVRTPPVTRKVVSAAAPLTLHWPAVTGASLYDVILWRGATRVLDLWPTTTHVLVPVSWTSGGKVFHRTGAMHFLWFVYPALGSKTSPTYGSLIRSGAF
jgi:hypothetical protein